jgi:hypothetical protein
MQEPDEKPDERESYEAPAVEVIDVVPEEALLAVCKIGSGSGPLGACSACSVSGS